MHLTTLEEYGIRCVLALARQGDDPEKKTLGASKIAELEGLSPDYVAKIMQIFRKKGLVSSVRGHQGGFQLKKRGADISLKEVMDCLQVRDHDSNKDSNCNAYTGFQLVCTHDDDCSLRSVWHILFSYFDEVLNALTLQDLIGQEKETQKLMQSLSLKTCKNLITRLKSADKSL